MKEQPIEAEAFAEFLENREAICLLAKCREEGLRVAIDFYPKSVRMVWTYNVALYKHLEPGGWFKVGAASGTSFLACAKDAIADMRNSGAQRSKVALQSNFRLEFRHEHTL